jgi:tetratricopeptide (TPR) repeat protein
MVETDTAKMKLMDEIRDAIKEKNWRTADFKILEYLKEEPHSPDALMYLGVSKGAQGYEPEGEQHLLASLTLEPGNRDAYYYLGVMVLEQGRCILARNALERGLTIDPSNHTILFQLGRALERLGEQDSAMDAYQRSLGSNLSTIQTEPDFTSEAKKAVNRLQNAKSQTSF